MNEQKERDRVVPLTTHIWRWRGPETTTKRDEETDRQTEDEEMTI